MNEENIKNSENIITNDTKTEKVAAETALEEANISKEENTAPKDFIDEFTPASIVIPKYDKEKELRKMEKINLKKKKKNSKKSKKRRRLIKKIVNVTCSILLSVLLFIVAVAIVSSVIVRVNTSRFAVESAIEKYGFERLIVGEIREHEKIGLNRSAENASMADVLRDNATIPVTYAFIEQEVNESTYPEFVSEITTDIIGYYVLGSPYKQVTADRIESLIYKNSSRIKAITGQELTESDCSNIAKYISKSSVYREISVSALNRQAATNYTGITSVLFSFPVLAGMILALVILIMLIALACKTYAYKIIGWTVMVAGIVSGVAGFIIKPMYTASTEFVRCIVDAVTTAFNTNALIYGIVIGVVGILVLLIGSAMKEAMAEDDGCSEIESEEYIEEIEQSSTEL